MKYLIISDIHGGSYFLEKVLEGVNDFDKLVILGDILYHGPRNDLPDNYDPKKVISILNAVKDKIVAVRGNCDAKIDLEVLDFEILDNREMEMNNHKCFLTHGDFHNIENLPILEGKYNLFHGHTHRNIVEEKGNVKVINVGSISSPKDGFYSYAIVEEDTVRVYDLIKGTIIFEEILI